MSTRLQPPPLPGQTPPPAAAPRRRTLGRALSSRRGWGYAVREVALIVVGILIALAINNWNERRQERRREVASLRELRTALRSDLRDIRSNIAFQRLAQSSTRTVLDHLVNDRPYADSLDRHFMAVVYGTSLIENTSAYETLKARGMELVSNDTLRAALGALYDGKYESLQQHEDALVEYRQTAMAPYYRAHFHGLTIRGATPNDPAALVRDPEYQGLVEWTLALRQFVLEAYDGLPEHVERLVVDLDREIRRLE